MGLEGFKTKKYGLHGAMRGVALKTFSSISLVALQSNMWSVEYGVLTLQATFATTRNAIPELRAFNQQR